MYFQIIFPFPFSLAIYNRQLTPQIDYIFTDTFLNKIKQNIAASLLITDGISDKVLQSHHYICKKIILLPISKTMIIEIFTSK